MIKPYYEREGVTLYHGDCLEIMEQLPDGSVDLIVTDPPYCSVDGKNRQRDGTGKKYCSDSETEGVAGRLPDFLGEDRTPFQHLIFCRTLFRRFYGLHPARGGEVLWFSDFRQLSQSEECAGLAGYVLRDLIAWDKGNMRPMPGGFRRQCEYIQRYGRGSGARTNPRVFGWGLIRQNGVPSRKRLHQTEKPVEVLNSILSVYFPRNSILDPFAGSGSTAIAALKNGNRCTLIEQMEKNCEISARRIEHFLKEGNDER